MTERKWRFVASEGRFADQGMKQVTEEEAEKCEYALCPLVGTVPAVPGVREEPCCGCERPVLVHPKDPVSPVKICLDCAGQILGGRN